MVRRNFQDLPVLRCRSLSPSVPYLYPDKSNEDIENKYRKGWYRADYGGSEEQKLWYLPKFSDRLKFLEYHVEKKKGYPRAVSVPPVPTTVRSISRPRPTTPTYYYTQPSTTTTYTYRSPYSPYLSTLGPYTGRQWSLDYYRYPYSSSYSWRYPYSYYSYPYSTYSTSLETQLALARADRALSRSSASSYYPSSYYRGYSRLLPSYHYDYDYFYPSLRYKSYDDDYLTYRYRPRVYDADDYTYRHVRTRSLSPARTSTQTYYLTY